MGALNSWRAVGAAHSGAQCVRSSFAFVQPITGSHTAHEMNRRPLMEWRLKHLIFGQHQFYSTFLPNLIYSTKFTDTTRWSRP